MSDRRVAWRLAVAGVGLWLAAALPLAAQDGPGPNLVIELAGQANGRIVIDLRDDVAPKHVAQITTLARAGA